MEATRRRLRELNELLALMDDGSLFGRAHDYALKEEHRFITSMFATEERIAEIERKLAAEKSIREEACTKLVDLGIGMSADQSHLDAIAAARLIIEASVTNTVTLTVQLTLQKNEKNNLLSKRTLERTLDSTSNRSVCIL